MSGSSATHLKFGAATIITTLLLAYLAYTGMQQSKSYYVTIKELHGMPAVSRAIQTRLSKIRIKVQAVEEIARLNAE